MSPRRRNRVAEHVAVVVAYAAGAAAAFAPPSPTERPLVDALLLGLSVGAVVYAAASAPWWAVALVAGAALVVAIDPLLIALAAVALALGVWVGLKRRNMPEWRAISAGISMNVLAWAELGGFLGLSAIVAIAAGVLLFVTGIRRRPRAIRRRAYALAGTVGVLAALAIAGFAAAAAQSRSSLENGQDLAEAGIDSLNRGDFPDAADQFERAASALRRADQQLARPWTLGASVVPVLAQHRNAAVELTDAGYQALDDVAVALREIDPASLEAVNGRIDLTAISALGGPFVQVQGALDDMAGALARADSRWLVEPADELLASLSDKLAENAPKLDNAIEAVELAPGLLGADGPRVYLVLFTTPSEARGLGGFAGNYAEVTVENGAFTMTDFGRVSDLELAGVAAEARIDGPEPFLQQYGRFGFDLDGDGLVGTAAWRNLTMTPHFPYVGEVAAQLYPQSGGKELDGVIVMDPYVVQALLDYTGPIELTTVGQQLTSTNAAEYILREQYLIDGDNATRIDALEEAASITFDTLLGGTLPDPTVLARDLGPFARERRLMVWTKRPDEQDLLRGVGILGEIPPVADGDGWSVALSNAGGNKIDSYLQRTATYDSTTDPATGRTTGTIHLELTNTSPASGLPNYIIGNAIGLPPGTSRLFVTFYSPLEMIGVTIDGAPYGLEPGAEAGWNVYSRFVTIPAGQTMVIDVELAGALERPNDLVTWEQPLVDRAPTD